MTRIDLKLEAASIGEALDEGLPSREPRLVRLSEPQIDELEGARFRTLRRAIRDSVEVVAGPEVTFDALPVDWAPSTPTPTR